VLLASVVPLKNMLSSSSSSGAPKGWTAQPFFRVLQGTALADPSGLSPVQIRAAYNLPSTGGSGTIAIVDAYDDPTIQSDLSTFSSEFGLPTANFSKHEMSSGIQTNDDWALEISLDVEWAHAIAPNATILLVEATSSDTSDLLAAINYARGLSAVVAISMSWGGSEFSGESSDDSYFTSSYGATFFASSGDTGGVVSWPAASPNVVGVGGTTLTFAANGSVSSETAWGDSGGGPSLYEAEPSYQVTYGVTGTSGKRGVPDVSYDANVSSGVSVYDSTPYDGSSGWWIVGGTSAGSPQWAAIQSLGLSAKNSNFYVDAKSASYSSYFRDITSGSNGPYNATVGYDLVTGLGSPLTTNFSPPGLASVTLNAPSSGSRLLPSTVSFAYTPVSVGNAILNSSLWTNATGSWVQTATNATAVVNGTQNTLSYALHSLGTVLWNVEVFNSAGGAFASFNYTLSITAVHLLLTEDPNQATYAEGQSVTLTVDVLNQLNPSLNSTLTLTVTGPGGYYYFDFQTVNVTANAVKEYSFTWNVPAVAGTYVVGVSLIPPQLTAYDAAWLQVV
jgi:subtilase family serine protease